MSGTTEVIRCGESRIPRRTIRYAFMQVCGLVNAHVTYVLPIQGADDLSRSSTVISNSLTPSNPSTAVAIEN